MRWFIVVIIYVLGLCHVVLMKTNSFHILTCGIVFKTVPCKDKECD